jgi:predicted nuclease of restriction endonuclease-like RecB superfamily
MLTAALRVYHWDRPTSSISSDRLEDDALPFLERALSVARARVGQDRATVRNGLRAALEGVRPDRVEPLVKLLDDAATYTWPRGRAPAERRVAAFERATEHWPPLDASIVQRILTDVLPGAEVGDPVAALYADYPAFHRLTAFPADYGAADLRDEYDLAQAQALLYSATSITLDASADLKHVVQHARLARLLHRLGPAPGGGYRFVFDGPSSILRQTRAYGVDFARFLQALVRARGWRLSAEISLRKGWRPLTFTLSAADGLRARGATLPAFDSTVEEALARRFGEERDGWRLSREATVVEVGTALFIPDFTFTHADGTTVLLEIVGYWRAEYVEEKFRKLAGVSGTHLIVAVPRRLAPRASELSGAVVEFRTRLRIGDVMAALEGLRAKRKGTR